MMKSTSCTGGIAFAGITTTASVFAIAALGAPALAGGPGECEIVRDTLPSTGTTKSSLFDVDVLAPDDVWAVGRISTATESLSLTIHYDGTAWSIVPSPSPESFDGEAAVWLYDVDFYSPTLGYAAGVYDGPFSSAGDNFAMEWDGSSWSVLDIPGVSQFGAQGFLLEAVEAIDPGNVWFGGQWNPGSGSPLASMIHFDGSDFTVWLLPRGPQSTTAAHRIRAISALAPDDIWAAGSAGGTASAVGRNYVAHFDGTEWTHVMTPQFGFGEILRDVVAIAPNDVWVAGRTQVSNPNGGPVITEPLFMHWDGSTWTRFPSPAFAADLVALASDDIYGVEGDTLIHWDGVDWSEVASLPSGDDGFINFLGVDAAGESDLIIVGTNWYFGDIVFPLAARYDPDCQDPMIADLNGDDRVDVADLLILLTEWGACPRGGEACPADLDGSGAVGVADLLLLIGAWG